DYYPELISIIVYPSGYTAHEDRHIGGGIWEEGGEDRLGHTGRRLAALVLAWDAVRHGAAAPTDGENLVLHEFAHHPTSRIRAATARRRWRRAETISPGHG
ncbi:MAG TPA: zinc-dependent peptidase, partial [Gemmatimonadaceae bacterium]|nr:zinc-dependent peptidase [Gemmatimonadaceae bacterium]